MKNELQHAAVGIAIWLSAITLSAQEQEPTYWMAGKLHPCTGDSVEVKEVFEYTTDGEKISLTVLGVTKEWDNWMDYEAEQSDFIHGTIEMAALQCGGAGGAMSMPAQAVSATFARAVFTHSAKPRIASAPAKKTASSGAGAVSRQSGAAQAQQPVELPQEEKDDQGKAVNLEVVDKEAAPRPMLPPNHMSADLEWDLFSHKGSTGNNFGLRAGYARTLSNQKLTLGGTIIINTMLMLQKLFFNNALNLYGTWLLAESGSLERKIGGSVNMFVVDKAFAGKPLGASGVISFSDNWFVGEDNILAYGAMVQQSVLADLKTTLLTAGVQYGLPIGQRFAANAHLVYAYNVLTVNSDGIIQVDNPMMLQPALSCSIYLSKLFSFDVGIKKTFLIEDYSDLIVTIGGSVLF